MPSALELTAFDTGVFTLSFDFELVWGSRDLTRDLPGLVAQAQRTRDQVFVPLLAMLADAGISATWATVGQLMLSEVRDEGHGLHPQVIGPQHPWFTKPWFDGVPEGTEAQHPAWYAQQLVRQLVEVGHEVGSHSFSHPIFSDEGCARQCADSDLAACVAAATAMGIELRSFVFPRNQVGHLDLLRRHGFTSWRGPAPTWYDNGPLPSALRRLGHFADVARAAVPPTVMPSCDEDGLWNVPASVSFLPAHGVRRHLPVQRRVARAIAGVDAAVQECRLCHLWLHPINLAHQTPAMLDGMQQIMRHVAAHRDAGRLEVLTMAQVVEKATAAQPSSAA